MTWYETFIIIITSGTPGKNRESFYSDLRRQSLSLFCAFPLGQCHNDATELTARQNTNQRKPLFCTIIKSIHKYIQKEKTLQSGHIFTMRQHLHALQMYLYCAILSVTFELEPGRIHTQRTDQDKSSCTKKDSKFAYLHIRFGEEVWERALQTDTQMNKRIII